MRHFCTYFDHRYLTRVLALHDSLRRHARPFHLYMLCLDEPARAAIDRLGLSDVTAVGLSEVEAHDHALVPARADRSLLEYYFTLTPAWPLFLFDRFPDIDLITYLDADLYFFSDPDPAFAAIGRASIAIVPHCFSPDQKHREARGLFNVGWVSWRRDAVGLACLRHYRQQCLAWCHDRLEDGKFADQKYLDDWPRLFSDVCVMPLKGVNLGPWAIESVTLGYADGRPTVDGEPLICFHFHGFKELEGGRIQTGLPASCGAPDHLAPWAITAPYAAALRQAAYVARHTGAAPAPSLARAASPRPTSGSEPLQRPVAFLGFSVSERVMAQALITERGPAALAGFIDWTADVARRPRLARHFDRPVMPAASIDDVAAARDRLGQPFLLLGAGRAGSDLVRGLTSRGLEAGRDFDFFQPKFPSIDFLGDYASADEARQESATYEDSGIVAQTLADTKAWRDNVGDCIVTRGEQRLLGALAFVLARTRAPLRVLDFGGGLGCHFFRLGRFLPRPIRWTVCETAAMAAAGMESFADEELRFISRLDEVVPGGYDVFLASVSLQYLDWPSQVVDRVTALNVRYVLIDRVPLLAMDKDRLTVQSVQTASYESSYPAWFFAEKPWLALLRRNHVVRMSWTADDDRPYLDGKRSGFQGLLLERKP